MSQSVQQLKYYKDTDEAVTVPLRYSPYEPRCGYSGYSDKSLLVRDGEQESGHRDIVPIRSSTCLVQKEENKLV